MRSVSRIAVSSWLTILPIALLTAAPQGPQRAAPQSPERAPSSTTALDRYVAAPDASFTWKAVRDLPAEGATATLLEMTSQRWLSEREVERPLWTHWITVVRPAKVTSDIGFLYITGGSLDRQPPSKPPAWLVDAARDTGTVTAELRLVPNQPIVFTGDPTHSGRSEDDFIAYTWNKFLRTGDEKWPARLPMTKSAVRAMDAVTAFTTSAAGGGHAATRFVVSGASKRGWTTWTTAAVDSRVIAIAPAVIDLLNIEPSFEHHFRAYGDWSDAVLDYVDQGIMDWMGRPEFKALMRIEEPYEYRDRLTMPKFIINASGDQFFLPDSSKFYFDGLRGEKHLRYVPNASHSLDKTDALESLQAFYASIVKGTARPEISSTFERDGTIKVVAKERPTSVVVWQAVNPDARNFRQDVIGNAYMSHPLTPAGPNTWIARVPRPPKGWTAFFVELTFPTGGKYPFKVTSGIRVLPESLPYAPPNRRRTSAVPAGPAPAQEFDLVVYGGTAGGVITAVTGAREGLKVALLEPGKHLGGMVSGGLGWTDYGKKDVIGGYSLEFFERVGKKYGRPIEWHFEPHVAESVFRELVAEAGVRVFLDHRLRQKSAVRKAGTSIAEITMEDGTRFRGKTFADATYEGDLMAQAGVSYTWGREGATEYGESLAGVREHTPLHQFRAPVSPVDASGRLLPEIMPRTADAVGAADKRVQAYNFRLCMTKTAENRVPWPKPNGYAPARFELLARYLPAFEAELGRPLVISDVMKPDMLQNGKTDTNNNGAFSTDYIGGSYDYPEGSYATRARIRQAHVDYIQGFLYFLATDSRVPAPLSADMKQWGLCKDEFTDTDHWPYQLYVREARRMVGEYVMSQRDIQTELTKPDVIGMGSYNSDSHNVQRRPDAAGTAVENEGDMQVKVTPYQIPYRVMLPKRAEASNLLVPVCFSATHVAYSTLRMEPQYMILGHAAGIAAKMAIDRGVAVQDVDKEALTARLKAQRGVFEDVPPTVPAPAREPVTK
jgi:PhoPQ-activated pathogenicity-related protein